MLPEIFIDNFAGGGGASTGASRALGVPVFAALNHNREALAMHRINHLDTIHYCEDIRTADPLKVSGGRPVGGVWFSPDCKHFSKAKGGKPRSKHIRGLAWVVIHWVNTVAPRTIFLENVEEFQTWCPLDAAGKPAAGRKGWFFKCFIGALRRRGYAVEWREERACDLGTPTIRKRLYLMARRDGRPIVWPAQTHAAPALAVAPLKPWRIIAECLDFSLPCPSIFLTRAQAKKARCVRPLAKATLKRIAKGVDRYVLKADRPFIISLTHQGGDRIESIDAPANTITGAHRGEKAVVSPVVVNVANSKTTGRGPNVWPTTEPARTITSAPGFALVAPVIAYAQHGGAVRPADAPAHTIAASTKDHNQLLAVNIVRHFGQSVGSAASDPSGAVMANGGGKSGLLAASIVKLRGDNVGHGAGEPAHTISAQGTHHGIVGATLVPYYGSETDGVGVTEPGRTVTTRDRFGLVEAVGGEPSLTPAQLAGARRVAGLRAFVQDKLGLDPAPAQAASEGKDNAFGFGWRHWERFDLPRLKIEKAMAGYTLHHELAGNLPDVIDSWLNGGGQITPTVERLRTGVPISAGKSPTEDLGTGGANYFFTRIQPTAEAAKSAGLTFKIGNLARLDSLSFDHDRYGDVRPVGEAKFGDYREKRATDPAAWKAASKKSGNETIFKNGFHLLEDVETIITETLAERQRVLAVFKSHGYETLPDGRLLADVVRLKG